MKLTDAFGMKVQRGVIVFQGQDITSECLNEMISLFFFGNKHRIISDMLKTMKNVK